MKLKIGLIVDGIHVPNHYFKLVEWAFHQNDIK